MAESVNGAGLYRPFLCNGCSKSFTRIENLQRHKRARHNGTSRKAFECSGCHARFSRSDVHKRHSARCRILAAQSPQAEPESQRVPTPPEMVDVSASISPPSFPVLEASWQPEHIPLNNASPQMVSASPSSVASGESTKCYIKAYLEHFHPSFPLIHRPTFSISSTPALLKDILAVIGSLYSTPSFDHDREACDQWRHDTWSRGNSELQRMLAANCSEAQKTWVLQTWILHIIYGAYLKNSPEFDEAKRMLRIIIDAVRELGLLIQGIAMPDSLSWLSQGDTLTAQGDSRTPYSRWTSYINTESLKVSLYALFSWELPLPSDLWEAGNSQIWLQKVTEQFGMISEDYLYSSHCIATASLPISTQQLMTESPGSELIAALAASPFTTLCILMNINALVRDFTRCYYQLPPSPSDPSTFHILTQAQNKQIYSAMRAISKIVKGQAYNHESPQFLLWRTIEITHCSLKISLCRPDHLLIGGIVDCSVIAGLATSTHLTLGNYVAVRRSTPLLPSPSWSDEGILAVLGDLAGAVIKIGGEEGGSGFREAPWVTASSYGILLCIWAALRRAKSDIQSHLDTFNELPRTSESSMLIFNTLIEAVTACLGNGEDGIMMRDPRIWSTDRNNFVCLLDEGEVLFISLLQKICRERSIWSIGPSMATVVEEILAAPQTTTALA